MSALLPDDVATVEELVVAGAHAITLVRPAAVEDLIDPEEFAQDERLPYWAELWPSGRVLADEMASRHLAGRRVVELGAGLGVPSLVAALGGADVLATDWYEPSLAFVSHNASRAGVAVATMLVDWREPPAALLAAGPFDLVMAADVLYEPRNAPPLAALVPRLVAPGGEVLLADPRRPDAEALLGALTAGGWDHEVREERYAGRPDEAGPVIRLHRLRPPGA
jgi:predicted nicotinamide N-methyase